MKIDQQWRNYLVHMSWFPDVALEIVGDCLQHNALHAMQASYTQSAHMTCQQYVWYDVAITSRLVPHHTIRHTCSTDIGQTDRHMQEISHIHKHAASVAERSIEQAVQERVQTKTNANKHMKLACLVHTLPLLLFLLYCYICHTQHLHHATSTSTLLALVNHQSCTRC